VPLLVPLEANQAPCCQVRSTVSQVERLGGCSRRQSFRPGQLPLLSPADRLSGQGNWTTDASRSFTRLVLVEFVHSSLSAQGVDVSLCFFLLLFFIRLRVHLGTNMSYKEVFMHKCDQPPSAAHLPFSSQVQGVLRHSLRPSWWTPN
jgi:hypothetical protein